MQFDAETPREEYTIAGQTFNIPCPFSEGDELTLSEGTADRLNQDVAENVRNNFAKRVKDAEEAGTFDQATFQTALDEYVASYEFGARAPGAGRAARDPIAREMDNIADQKVRAALKKAGKKLSGKDQDITAKDLAILRKDYVTKYEAALRPLAEAAVAQMAELPDAA